MSFCLGTPVESPEILKIGILGNLEGHNFLSRTPIAVSFKAKLHSLSRTFQ
jgi:hypothetical protein